MDVVGNLTTWRQSARPPPALAAALRHPPPPTRPTGAAVDSGVRATDTCLMCYTPCHASSILAPSCTTIPPAPLLLSASSRRRLLRRRLRLLCLAAAAAAAAAAQQQLQEDTVSPYGKRLWARCRQLPFQSRRRHGGRKGAVRSQEGLVAAHPLCARVGGREPHTAEGRRGRLTITKWCKYFEKQSCERGPFAPSLTRQQQQQQQQLGQGGRRP